MRWYADNSELNGIRGANIPDILLFGGIIVTKASSIQLKESIEKVKGKYGFSRAPIKWNFKDLKRTYSKLGQESLYQSMLNSSKLWRSEIAEAVRDIDFKIIIACIESHSSEKKVIKGVKENLVGFVFSNALMRVALYAQEASASEVQVILDWPDGGNSNPFDIEYASAYNFGSTRGEQVKYHSGALKDLRFMDSPVYTNMLHSTLLQFSDLILGATREVIECAVGKKKSGFGLDFSKLLSNKFRGSPDDIYGRGIVVASGNTQFKEAIKSFIDSELGCSNDIEVPINDSLLF